MFVTKAIFSIAMRDMVLRVIMIASNCSRKGLEYEVVDSKTVPPQRKACTARFGARIANCSQIQAKGPRY